MARPVVITGGGTGGHVFPMQAIAEALRARGLGDDELRFVGSRRGQEASLLSGLGVALTLLPGRGLRRSLRPGDLFVNLGAALGLLAALVMALVKIRRWRAGAVVSVGGYASFPASFAAVCWGVPLVLVELDAEPGAAQRLFGRVAAARCCAFPTEGPRVFVTGTPLREAIESLERTPLSQVAARAAQEPPIDAGRAVVVVMTGSLGASRVNDAVVALARLWSSREDVAIIHVTGRRDYDTVRARVPQLRGLDYRVVDFGDMRELWLMADVAVCRAGAVTLAELANLAIPSVLVPLPGAPGDHQAKNARAVARAGGALIVPDGQCTAQSLAAALDDVLEPAARAAMAEGARSLARPRAAAAIAEVVARVRGAA